jgi:hypothetical protein
MPSPPPGRVRALWPCRRRLDSDERLIETLTADHVDTLGASDRDDIVSAQLEDLDEVRSDPAGGSGDRNPLALVFALHRCSFLRAGGSAPAESICYSFDTGRRENVTDAGPRIGRFGARKQGGLSIWLGRRSRDSVESDRFGRSVRRYAVNATPPVLEDTGQRRPTSDRTSSPRRHAGVSSEVGEADAGQVPSKKRHRPAARSRCLVSPSPTTTQ